MKRHAGPPWSVPLRLDEAARGPAVRRLAPDEAARKRIAESLGLAGLPAFEGEARVAPWRDGVEVEGRWTARVVYTCGITLEPFEQALEGEFAVRAVPPDSPLAVEPESGPEEELSLEAEDPPDVVQDGTIDLGAYLVEHLALELDPFPRKPGAVFEPPPAEAPESPFAVLRSLKKD